MSRTPTNTRRCLTEHDVISCDPDVVSGTPVFRGTRVPVTTLFGVYFIGANARATDGCIPVSSWKSAGAKRGMQIVALGTLMLLAATATGGFRHMEKLGTLQFYLR